VLLDVDLKNGLDGRKALEALDLDVSGCPRAITPSGGLHYYFRAAGHSIRNSAGKLGPSLDIRGDGGYAILPPSMPDPKPPPYWRSNDILLMAAPSIRAKLLSLLAERTDELVAECSKIRAAAPGSRNTILNAAAFVIAKLVLKGILREGYAKEELIR